MTAAVPCNGCTACCWNDVIVMHPEQGDNIASYKTKVVPNNRTGVDTTILEHREDGACIYLGDAGCTIHDRAPFVCRRFDCRRLLAAIGDRAEQRRAIKAGLLPRSIYAAAKALPPLGENA